MRFEIASTAQTTVLVNTPNMGDEVQTLKAGIMEIADVLGVNKADLPGAARMVSALKALLSLAPDQSWEPPVLRMIATQGEGVEALADACETHHAHLLGNRQDGVKRGSPARGSRSSRWPGVGC